VFTGRNSPECLKVSNHAGASDSSIALPCDASRNPWNAQSRSVMLSSRATDRLWHWPVVRVILAPSSRGSSLLLRRDTAPAQKQVGLNWWITAKRNKKVIKNRFFCTKSSPTDFS